MRTITKPLSTGSRPCNAIPSSGVMRMPTINPAMDYAKLEGIREGTAASDGFIEAIQAGVSPGRKAELDEQLRRYCRFDTEAMVEIVRFFTR